MANSRLVPAASVLLALILPAFPPSAAPATAEPAAQVAASRFYRVCLKLNPRGLPTEEQMREMAPLMSADLVKLIASARRKQEESIRRHPDDKPPWIEGDLFASNFEGVSSFRLGTPATQAGKASIPVYLEYRDGKDAVRWIDVIVLERAGGQWRVWNIYMNAPWPFKSGPDLRAMLSGE